MSSGRRLVLEQPEEVAGHLALEPMRQVCAALDVAVDRQN